MTEAREDLWFSRVQGDSSSLLALLINIPASNNNLRPVQTD
jgi:hypothetical protein